MNDLFKPAFVEVRIKESDYINTIKDMLEKMCGVKDIDVYISVDNETGFVRVVIDEDKISEEDAELLFDNGFNIQEWYEMTLAILRTIFKTENVSSYIDLNEYESMVENNELIIPIQIGFKDYLNISNSVAVATPKGVISAFSIDDDYYPYVATLANGKIATITEFDHIKESIRTHVYKKDEDEPIATFEW